MSEEQTPTVDVTEALSAVFAIDDKLAALTKQKQEILDSLYDVDKGPWQTSRGELQLAKVSPGRKANGAKSRVVLRPRKMKSVQTLGV